MGKWTSLEHLSFYTFIIFNYDYIHNKKIIPKIVQNPQNPDQKSEKATKKLRRGKQLSGEFYTKMEEFFETELPNHKSRTRSQLRCKMNKLFPKKTKENLKRKKGKMGKRHNLLSRPGIILRKERKISAYIRLQRPSFDPIHARLRGNRVPD